MLVKRGGTLYVQYGRHNEVILHSASARSPEGNGNDAGFSPYSGRQRNKGRILGDATQRPIH